MSSLLWHFFLKVKNEREIRFDHSHIKNPPPMTGGGEDLTASCLYIRLTSPSQQHSTTNRQPGEGEGPKTRAP